MRIITKKLLAITTLSVVLLAPAGAFAAYDFIIKSYNINMVVNENNTFNITENIGVYFNIPRHGLLRKIPLKNEIVRLNGTKSHNRAEISDISMTDQYITYKENNDMVIKIDDSDKTLTGAKNYSIIYTYNIGKDTGKGYDELYFNLIGSGWKDTTISNISFTITMPKSFDKSKLGFSAGAKSSTKSKNVSYKVDGNVITGQYKGTLNPGEALTVRLELPEGYFTGSSYNFDLLMLAALFLPVIFAFMFFLLFFSVRSKYGKSKPIEIVEFYPPKEFNSAEVGFLYKGSAEDKDVVSLLIYLANKGYVKISETIEKSLFSKKEGFKITRIKNYDGDNLNERIFLTDLFRKKPTFSQIIKLFKNRNTQDETDTDFLDEVTSTDLYDSFYITLREIKNNLNNKENKEKIFEKGSLGKGIWGIIAVIIIFLLITIRPVWEHEGIFGESSAFDLTFALAFPGVGFSILIIGLLGIMKPRWFLILFGIGFGGIPWAWLVLPALLDDSIYLMTYFVGLACVTIIIVLIKHMRIRTVYGNKMLAQIKGFKTFLETAEKVRLEALVMTDPEYFFNILPYTYVLEVSEKWIKKFETIAMKAPDWYEGTGTFNAVTFGAVMGSTMALAVSAMSSSPSSSSDSGSSGGGSSGGGSGGGGGSSW